MNECMFNDTPARKPDRLLGRKEGNVLFNDAVIGCQKKVNVNEMVIKFKIEKYFFLKTQCKELGNK